VALWKFIFIKKKSNGFELCTILLFLSLSFQHSKQNAAFGGNCNCVTWRILAPMDSKSDPAVNIRSVVSAGQAGF